MRFLLDEHLPTGLVGVIAELGHQALHVKSEGLLSAGDADLWTLAAELDAVVMSKDSDFLALAQRDNRIPGLLRLALGNISNRTLYDVIGRAWPELIERLERGEPIVELRHD